MKSNPNNPKVLVSATLSDPEHFRKTVDSVIPLIGHSKNPDHINTLYSEVRAIADEQTGPKGEALSGILKEVGLYDIAQKRIAELKKSADTTRANLKSIPGGADLGKSEEGNVVNLDDFRQETELGRTGTDA